MIANDNLPTDPVTAALGRALAGLVAGRIVGDGKVVFLSPRTEAAVRRGGRPRLRLVQGGRPTSGPDAGL